LASHYNRDPSARVAELVDAQVSEACPRKGVLVRFQSRAPSNLNAARWRAIRTRKPSATMMRRLILLTLTALAACDAAPPPARKAPSTNTEIQTITTVHPQAAILVPPPMLQDEAPPPKPKLMPWQTQTPIVFSPEDEKLRASLPFTPAIAMDPLDGSKISIRASTPTFEYKGKIYYFSSQANKQIFAGNPEHALKGGYMRL
jgi:YHS domain-containing protein